MEPAHLYELQEDGCVPSPLSTQGWEALLIGEVQIPIVGEEGRGLIVTGEGDAMQLHRTDECPPELEHACPVLLIVEDRQFKLCNEEQGQVLLQSGVTSLLHLPMWASVTVEHGNNHVVLTNNGMGISRSGYTDN